MIAGLVVMFTLAVIIHLKSRVAKILKDNPDVIPHYYREDVETYLGIAVGAICVWLAYRYFRKHTPRTDK